ncbi:MAG: hypothetical protein KAS12_06415, partial [Candidatus Aenigmarchaeota archaeon]|nr:hypothetical protein [Candidatus Aenigmarchaeota archaeon]
VIDWVFFPNNPYVLKSKNETIKTIGGSISDWKKINFVLNVPKDAETCNHAFKINPSPYAAKELNNAVSIVAMTAITVKFNIGGECIINGTIIDAVQSKSSNDNTNLGVYFQNIGTATIIANSPKTTIAFENGTIIDNTNSGYISVTPNEVGILNMQFNSKKIVPGNYIITTNVVYGMNETTKQIKVTIVKPENIITIKSTKTNKTDSNYAYWILVLLIIIITYSIYKKDDN